MTMKNEELFHQIQETDDDYDKDFQAYSESLGCVGIDYDEADIVDNTEVIDSNDNIVWE